MDIFRVIQIFADYVTYDLLQLTMHSYWGDALNFFIYDVIKIGLLLVLINFIMAVVRYYLPIEKIRDILTK
ncbi:permease, partial [Candidatus Dojkabacteria bacterium]|nr:permease [Candidatus Dojkabacteria bacterium]